jgi:RNA polymerase sigma factor (sigma-70 family)
VSEEIFILFSLTSLLISSLHPTFDPRTSTSQSSKDGAVHSRGSKDPAGTPPPELSALLSAPDAASRERAWSAFIEKHSKLILHTVRSFARDYDRVMNCYAYVLDRLRQDDFRRLRSYVADGRGKLTTWLTVVVRRLSLDHHRQRYGRLRGKTAISADEEEIRTARRNLADLVSEQLHLRHLADPTGGNPERDLRRRQLAELLERAVGALDPRDRLLLRLRFDDDLSAREVAEILRFPTPFHVYRRLNKVFEILRHSLEQRGVDGPTP